MYNPLTLKTILRIQSQQNAAHPTADAAKRNDETVALAIERMKAEKLAASMSCADQMTDGFNSVANMTAEEEAAMNTLIETLDRIGEATDAPYPADLLAARRASFVAQIGAMAIDPDAVDVDTPPVSDEQDERNSRPFPF